MTERVEQTLYQFATKTLQLTIHSGNVWTFYENLEELGSVRAQRSQGNI